ncbi:tRNA uridine-5-carboxymethylaminomethyl(34) synthesis enzyme MnmG, partial [Eubacteriales bacterium OttesenSCG-928-N14]|nr:tRNA uridine-5-carboxymethylaminomethyl(34) synthesis enzyme MnmG [Eubacteriales bacterium OttesenSCG-928-N14]
LTLSLDAVALMACNPAIGGTSKGHLVREVDALGGQMGLAIDATFLQSRMINTKKGPAVHSLRAQADKQAYTNYMKCVLEHQPNLTLLQGSASEILLQGDAVSGIALDDGGTIACKTVVVASGVYLNSRIITGEYIRQTGPNGLQNNTTLSQNLQSLGFSIMRFKTGTPPRIAGESIDTSVMEVQQGDAPVVPFSFLSNPAELSQRPQWPCYLTYTNENTHAIIRQNLHRSPMYSGVIDGTGARYCPSIEDKIVRFAERGRHQLFVEPEGLYTDEKYLQGFSTSLPVDVQQAALATVPGLEQARIVRPGYAIEYDCIDGRSLSASLMSKQHAGLFFAGQIVGSSGYEEAAAQGVLAGINAAHYLQERPPLILDRSAAYLGVLVDDLTIKGTPEPYRMMTSRAEYRLLLRQDNADLRLTQLGYEAGLVTQHRYDVYQKRKQAIEAELQRVEQSRPTAQQLAALGEAIGKEIAPSTFAHLLKRQDVDYALLATVDEASKLLPVDIQEQVSIMVKYEGYIQNQLRDVQRFAKQEQQPIPPDMDYHAISALRIEARQKLAAMQPQNMGQASRISGVSPADIAVLHVYLERLRRDENAL